MLKKVLPTLVLFSLLCGWAGASVPLTWAPPEGYENYTPFVIPAKGGLVNLPCPDTDYYIIAPDTITGALHLRGGRNVVWIGGHIQIDIENASSPTPPATSRRGLVISDAVNGASKPRYRGIAHQRQ